MSDLTNRADKILRSRYFWKDDKGTLIEKTWEDLCRRVSTEIAKAEIIFGKDPVTSEAKFYEMMQARRFIPNTPTLTNAGRDRGQLAACSVLPINDSMEEIMETIKSQAILQKHGVGTGFNFGSIRERGSRISTTGMIAAGPIPIIKLMNYMMSEFIFQGGIRPGANIGLLPCSHPDIKEFITFKREDGSCKSFNISVSISDDFMNAVLNGSNWDLISPLTNTIVKTVKAKDLFDLIATTAHETGDPGTFFIDTINRYNPTPNIGKIEACNPCGEISLLPMESCTLGHHNLVSYYKRGSNCKKWQDHINWAKYAEDITWAVRFLDNVVEVNYYALPEMEKIHKLTNRKIGLGVMGFADLLIKLNVSYASEEGRAIANEIAKFHREHADLASYNLALERGSFTAFEGSMVQDIGWSAMRNASRTTIAPTGTTSVLAGCSTSIEPIFGLITKCNQANMIMYETHPLFEKYLDKQTKEDRKAIYSYYDQCGTILGCPQIPENMQQIFAQANDIKAIDHIKMQATWQSWIDNSISKSINMPSSATVEDVKEAYIMAWQYGCKGICVYVNGSRKDQTLSISTSNKTESLCPECGKTTELASGCQSCRSCGWGKCSIR